MLNAKGALSLNTGSYRKSNFWGDGRFLQSLGNSWVDFIEFKGFQAILMVLAVWARFFNWNGVEIIPKYGLESDFWTFVLTLYMIGGFHIWSSIVLIENDPVCRLYAVAFALFLSVMSPLSHSNYSCLSEPHLEGCALTPVLTHMPLPSGTL